MSWFAPWFDYPADPLLLAGSYNPGLVLLSVLMAVFAPAMAIQITVQAISVAE